MQIINDSFFAPFYVFIKAERNLSDEALLQAFDLKAYQLVTEEEEREMEHFDKRYLFITEDAEWTHLMDDFCYTLWHLESLSEKLEVLSQRYDIFCCSVGNVDDSFDFIYDKNGKVVRDYVVEDLQYNGGVVVKNEGTPLAGEEKALQIPDRYAKVLALAQLIGVNPNHQLQRIRCYGTKEFSTTKTGL
ncbi:MAG: hypothetical protein AB8G15_22800 [Saprospiraceae bacterium]